MTEFYEGLCSSLQMKINKHNLSRYHTKYPEWGNGFFFQKPMYVDIECGEYEKLRRRIGIELSENELILEYIKCRKKSRILFVLDAEAIKHVEIENFYQQKNKLIKKRVIYLSLNGMRSLFYQFYLDENTPRTIKEIDDRISENLTGHIIIYIIDDLEVNDLKLWIEGCENGKEYYLSKHFYQTVELSGVILNDNSLKFLEKQKLERFLDIKYRKSRIMLATFRRWIYQMTNFLERKRMIVLSSCILYTYGLRNIKDMDIYVENSQNYLPKVIRTYLIDDETRFCFVDVSARNTEKYAQYRDEVNRRWFESFGVNGDYAEIMNNSKYYYYFMGIKFLYIEADIKKRQLLLRPKALADLIQIRRQIDGYGNIMIPDIPKMNRKGEEIEKERYMETMVKYMKYLYYEDWTLNDIECELNKK